MNKFKNIIVENCPYNSYFCSYDSKWNYIDEDGNLLSPINFDWAFPFNSYGVDIELTDNKEYTEQEELVNDMMMLIASFSGRLYSARAKENIRKSKENS